MSIAINLAPLLKLEASVASQLAQSIGGTGPISDGFRAAAIIYRSFVQRRFDRNSKGGGDWLPLAKSTIARRRKGKGTATNKTPGGVAILRDTGTLFRALDPVFTGAPGALQQAVPYGVIIGFGGPAKYPGSKATIADIAGFHDLGGKNGRPPRRRIIVGPPEEVLKQIASVFKSAIDKAKQQAGSA